MKLIKIVMVRYYNRVVLVEVVLLIICVAQRKTIIEMIILPVNPIDQKRKVVGKKNNAYDKFSSLVIIAHLASAFHRLPSLFVVLNFQNYIPHKKKRWLRSINLLIISRCSSHSYLVSIRALIVIKPFI